MIMKRIFALIISLTLAISLVGCGSGDMMYSESNAGSVDSSYSIPYYVAETDSAIYVDCTVNSINVEEGKITSVSDLGRINDWYSALSDDGTLADGYVFVTVEVTLNSPEAIDSLSLSCFWLSYGKSSKNYDFKEPSYISDSAAPDDVHNAMTVNVTANEDKTVTIGYLMAKSGLEDAKYIALGAAFTDFGDDGEYTNPLIKLADSLEELS